MHEIWILYKDGILFLFYCILRKTLCPYQRTKACLQFRDLQTYLDAHAQWVSFNRMLFRRLTKPHLLTSISFHEKALSTLNIYEIVIRLKSQVLSKKDSRLVSDRQTCNHFFWLKLKTLGTLDRRAHHLSYKGGPKSPPHIFLYWPIWIVLTWGRLWKSYVLSQGSDVAYIGHWPRAIYLFDRQTDRLTDRQTNR